MTKLNLVLESVRDEFLANSLEESDSEVTILKRKHFLNENINFMKKIIIEENVLGTARDRLNRLDNEDKKRIALGTAGVIGTAGLVGLASDIYDTAGKTMGEVDSVDHFKSTTSANKPPIVNDIKNEEMSPAEVISFFKAGGPLYSPANLTGLNGPLYSPANHVGFNGKLYPPAGLNGPLYPPANPVGLNGGYIEHGIVVPATFHNPDYENFKKGIFTREYDDFKLPEEEKLYKVNI